MQLGLIGLGKMGFNMRERLRGGGHEVIGYDPRPEVSDVPSLAALAEQLEAPRVVWVMVPSGEITRETIEDLAGVLSSGDLVIDGGNSRYTEDGIHAKLLADKGIGFIDAGVSGGVWGLTEGYGLMIGGSDDDVARVMPIFETLRPEGDLADGFVHAGPVGAGHFAKMVHNGVEYALMTAYGDVDKAVAAMRGGACDFLMKPFEPELLLESVRRYAALPLAAEDTIAEDPHTLNLLALAAGLSVKSPLVLARMKEALNDAVGQPAETALRRERDLNELHALSHDRAEGLAAFREKRAPQFQGR